MKLLGVNVGPISSIKYVELFGHIRQIEEKSGPAI